MSAWSGGCLDRLDAWCFGFCRSSAPLGGASSSTAPANRVNVFLGGFRDPCPGLFDRVRAGPERLRAVVEVDVSFASVSAATRVRGKDDDDAVPALRELSEAEAWRGRRPTGTCRQC